VFNIACYNLRFGGKAANRVHWQHVFDAAQPALFLAQECCDPVHYLTPEQHSAHARGIHWRPVENVRWGSAVFVRVGRVRPLALTDFAGYVTGVEVRGLGWPPASKRPLRVFSIHVPAPYVRPMNQILDAIKALPGADACDHVIAGDFNLTTGVRHPSERRQQHNLFLLDRMRREFNLINAWQVANPNRDLPQTLRWGRDKSEPYHCDAIFLPAAWYRHLESCEVLSSPEWDRLSDHNPVVARLV
jgi:endonuclease/exonuclease/phosphatase family metal-dependent hydrolase